MLEEFLYLNNNSLLSQDNNFEWANNLIDSTNNNENFISGANLINLENHVRFSEQENLISLELNHELNNNSLNSQIDQITGQALQQAYNYLNRLGNNSDLIAKLEIAFGNEFNTEIINQLITNFDQRNFQAIPTLKIVSSQMINGANGAYDSLNGFIYLSEEFVNANNVGAIASVILEEIGHFIDSRINESDSSGDEGEIFAALVQGRDLSTVELSRMKAEDDTATIFLEGKEVVIEQNTDLAGNIINSARNLGTLNGTFTCRDYVGRSDLNDYYRFSLNNTSNFNLSLTGMSADADVQLLDAFGRLIQSSTNSGTTADTISRTLNAGTYYVRVFPYGNANTYYNLNLTANPIDLAGNTISSARNLGTLNGTFTYRDYVGRSDLNDYYRFSLSNTSNFNLSLTGMSADADVQLLDAFGRLIQSSTNSGTTVDTISRTLNAGTYYVRVFPYGNANTYYNLNLTARPIFISDWFSQNLRDPEIINRTRTLATDNLLSRNDMISIFRNAQDGNVISADELMDLRTIVHNGSRFSMPDYVRVLSNKVVNGNQANVWWTGGAATRTALGNLFSGSSATQMERLIGKWFLGLDRPTASSNTAYRYASGSLFQNGISYQDINQGSLGDCYFLTGLAGAAFRSPNAIQNMFTDNGDGTYTVRFYNNGIADYVTVDRYLPTDFNGRFVYANRDKGLLYNNSANELWVALAEKAYAQINESVWMNRGQTNSYAGIEGGWPDTALRQITARGNVLNLSLTDSDRTNIINQFNAGRTVFLNWADHALTMVGYNASTQLFRIYNPWGVHYNLTWAQILNGGGGSQRYTDWSYSTT